MGLEVEVVGETNKFDVVVIGGGIAGMTASATVTASGLKSCFLEKDVPGGKVMRLDTIHNFPPSPGIKGQDLGLSLFHQVTDDIKTNYIFGNVQAIRPKNDLFYLFTEDGQTWEAKAIIICIGTINKKLGLVNEDKFLTKGLSYCVMCDAALTKGKKVILVGNTTHLDLLKQYTNDVTLLKSSDVKELIGDNHLNGIVKADGTQIPCDWLFVENGYEYKTDFLPIEVNLTDIGEVIVDQDQQTNFKGIYAAGDCTNAKVKMIVPAIEEATKAANSAIAYIKSRNW